MNELEHKLESVLFVASKPTSTALLAKIVSATAEETEQALRALAASRKDTGIIVMEANGQWQLGTNPHNVELVKAFLTADLREKLTDATVEVLGIIAYRQPISKMEIEAIRGVNCQYSIRQLLMRGLIEKVANPNDSRSNLYQITTEFLQHMGMQTVADLPEFEKLTASVKLPETPQTRPNAEPEPSTTTLESTSYSTPHNYSDPTGYTTPAVHEPTPAATEPNTQTVQEDEFEDEDDDDEDDI
jgi:segregation and condensation protein B